MDLGPGQVKRPDTGVRVRGNEVGRPMRLQTVRWRPLAVLSVLSALMSVPRPLSADRVIGLSYNADLAAAGFPSPLLRATVNGQAVWFLVDTGAAVHTLASWFAKAAHLPTRASKTMLVGSTGATSQAKAAGTIQVETRDGSVFSVADAMVADFPQVFTDQRIAGLLSPQLLAPMGQAAVLNLRTPSLSFGPFRAAISDLGLVPSVATAGTRVCPTQGMPAGRTYGVHVTVAGIQADMTADTGSTSTVVASSRIARALAARAVSGGELQGVGGDAQATKTVAGVTVVRAGVARPVDVTLGNSADSCGTDGLLGMDSLRGCTLILSDTAMAWSCGGS